MLYRTARQLIGNLSARRVCRDFSIDAAEVGPDNGDMPSTRDTEDEFTRLIEGLRGTRVVGITYYPLTCGEDGTEIEEWDFGEWHQPTMGVELLAEDGTRYSAVWGHTFGYHGLEIFKAPMSSQLALIGQPGGSADVDVTGHPLWSGFIEVPLVGADILWGEGAYENRLPVAVGLTVPDATVWLVAGSPMQWPPDGRFRLGTNDVMVVFSRTLAAAIGLPVAR